MRNIRHRFITIVMPARNEREYICKNLNSLLNQDYPCEKFEIIVADGMSTDGTREFVEELSRQDSRVRVIDNPAKIVSTGLNAVILESRGDIVIRVDGHAEVAADFVRQSVAVLQEHPEAWGVGGPIVHIGRGAFGKAAAIAMSHRAGVGNASHRQANYEGFGEGTAFPAFHRWVFDKVGLYDESLVRNQDDEFYFRVIQAGGKFYISPRIRYQYFVRNTLRALAKQYFQYSFWRIPVMRKHHRPTTLRQMVPSLFYAIMLVLLIIGVCLHNWPVAVTLPSVYFIVLAGIGLSSTVRYGFSTGALVPIAMLTMHASYAVGMWYGWLAMLVRPSVFSRNGSMSSLSR